MDETIHVLGEGGSIIPMDLPLPESIADRLTAGQLRRVNADGSPYREAGTALTEGRTPRPSISAPKSHWVAYAMGALGMSEEEASGKTKKELADLVDASNVDEPEEVDTDPSDADEAEADDPDDE